MPSFQAPPFSYVKDNSTFGFFDMCADLGSGIIVVPLIGLLENIAICKAFGEFIKRRNFIDSIRTLLLSCIVICS